MNVTMIGPTIALYKPQIPPNTGNISRLCVALNSFLYIIGKPNFQWDEASLKRAGLDHWKHLQFKWAPRYRDFIQDVGERRIVAVTKSADTTLFDFEFQKEDILLFGNEQMGLPPSLLKTIESRVRIPMFSENVRSLNLSNAAAVAAYEYIKQIETEETKVGLNYKRTYYNSDDKGK